MFKFLVVYIVLTFGTSYILYSHDTIDSASVEIAADTITKTSYKSAIDYSPISQPNYIDIDNADSRIESSLENESNFFVRQYGGRSGISTLSIRGGNPSSSIILLNGMRLSSPQNGIFDFSQLSSSILSSIEYIPSGSGIYYGSNAMSGIVNLNTLSRNNTELTLGYGSYDDYQVSSSIDLERFGLAFSYNHFSGMYPFQKFNRNLTRNNAAYDRFNLLTDYSGESYNFTMLTTYNNRGVPGPVIFRNPENDTLSNTSFMNMLVYNQDYNVLSGRLRAGLSVKTSYDNLQSNDISIATYLNNGLQTRFVFDSENLIGDYKVIAEGGYDALNGDNLDVAVSDYIDRLWTGVAFSQSYILKDFIFNSGLRLEQYSGLGEYLNGSFGILWNIDDWISLSGQISNNTRVPSFNELYYQNFGNSDLKTEKNLSIPIELEIVNTIYDISYAFETSIFYNIFQDMILAIPITPLIVSARNIQSSKIYGIDSELNLSYDNITFGTGYLRQVPEETLNNETSVIPNVPQEKVVFNLAYNSERFSARINHNYLSFRYLSRGNDASRILPSFSTTDMQISYNLELDSDDLIETSLYADNIFDTQYEVIENYPMPGIIIGLNISYKVD